MKPSLYYVHVKLIEPHGSQRIHRPFLKIPRIYKLYLPNRHNLTIGIQGTATFTLLIKVIVFRMRNKVESTHCFNSQIKSSSRDTKFEQTN